MKEYYTIQEIAERYRINPETVRRLLVSGKLKGVKIGDSWRVKKSDIDNMGEGIRK